MCRGQGLGSPVCVCVGRGADSAEEARQALNIVPKAHTHLDWPRGRTDASTRFWENRFLPPLGAATLHSCKSFWNHFDVEDPTRATRSPSTPKTPWPGKSHPPGMRPPLLLGSWGRSFRKRSTSPLLSSPARTRGEQEKRAKRAPAPGEQPCGPRPWFSPVRSWEDRGGRRVRALCCERAVLRRGRCDIRAGLLRDPPALSCDPHATLADSWSPSVGCACRSELAHWRGPGNALISLVQMRPGIS